MTAPHPEAALSAREAEKTADPRDRYYGEDGAVWKAPIETRKENGTTSISIGFKVCTMTDVVGPEAADTVADLMNAGVAALSTAHTATAGDGGEHEPMTSTDAVRLWEIEQAALAQAPAVQAPAGVGVPLRGIYMASKTAHAPRWRELRGDGRPIISTWIDEAGKGETACFKDLWRRCIDEAATARALIVYMEPGEVLKGAFVEVGAALACGIPVYAVGCDEFSFTNHIGVTRCEALSEALALASSDALALASPTPTDAQLKAARPVGDEASRSAEAVAIPTGEERDFWLEAAEQHGFTWNGDNAAVGSEDALLKLMAAAREQGRQDMSASHPTTGQETVATPRDGASISDNGIETNAERLHRLKTEWGNHQPIYEGDHPWLLSMASRGVAASGAPAPREDGVREALEPGRRAYGAYASSVDSDKIDRQPAFGPWDDVRPNHKRHWAAVEAALATPSPAQEPGTGDTGDGWSPDRGSAARHRL